MLNIKKYFFKVSFCSILFSIISPCFAKNPVIFTDKQNEIKIGLYCDVLEDTLSNMNIQDVLNGSFTKSSNKTLNLDVSSSTFWIRFSVKNKTDLTNLLLHISNPLIDEITLYNISNNTVLNKQVIKGFKPISSRKYNHQDFIFDLNVSSEKTKIFLLKIESSKMIILPISIGSPSIIEENTRTKDMIFGVFFGLMLVMFLYNIFIYFTVKDISYLFYVIYILFVALTQLNFQGYTYKYLWNNNPWLIKHSFFLLSIIVGISAGEFIRYFLNIKKDNPRLDKGFFVFYLMYALGLILMFTKTYSISHKVIDITALTISLYIYFTLFKLTREGNRSAIFLLISWSFFLIGVTIFALKNFGILPSNNYTEYTMPIGSAIETILLSFALADRINVYKKEKEASQQEAIQSLKSLNRATQTHNIELESRVKKRTEKLDRALQNLKATQTQLVDAEKMASLGQLTAGIAHEINNPINFVSSNISPLKQDINDLISIIDKYNELTHAPQLKNQLAEIENYKNQIDYEYLKSELNTIINGIENGAKRTTEIVNSLRNFSRLDESDLMMADINEGITSTLALLKSNCSTINIVQKLAPLPKIECYPGKLNQVFMNILNNAIHAIEDNSNLEKGEIHIETIDENDFVKIIINDNGTGIEDKYKEKIFDPFFTTKEVGKGTGLGLSIVYSIIKNHNGKIEVVSESNKGTTFIITLPKMHH